jgi:hypothetical protein
VLAGLGAAVLSGTAVTWALVSAGASAGVIREDTLTVGEIVYRCFMAFYGLVFPAYVWLCMIPTRDGHSGPSRQKILVWAFAVGIAAPMFWMGFIERQTWWLAPGLAMVLVARLMLPQDQDPRARAAILAPPARNSGGRPA